MWNILEIKVHDSRARALCSNVQESSRQNPSLKLCHRYTAAGQNVEESYQQRHMHCDHRIRVRFLKSRDN
jgi:hypothetical protein